MKPTNSCDLFIVIMAGGEGTRFKPLSTPARPKQFLNFIGEKTFIRQTFERILPLVPVENIYVSTNDRYVQLVKEQLPEVRQENIIGEPLKKNTAPALVYCTSLIHQRNNSATVICLPSDHYISDENGFRRVLESSVKLAEENYLVTLGMKPTWPSPDFGYIKHEVGKEEFFKVEKFTEKPDMSIAKKYIAEGYLWNGGIFIWKAKVFLDEVEKHALELLPVSHPLSLVPYFSSVPSISIDYALMEKSDKVAVIPCDVGWSDVGTWEGLYDLSNANNVVVAKNVTDEMCRQLGFVAPDKSAKLPMIVQKPWGHEEIWAHTEDYVGKILVINKSHRLSYQYHRIKEETIRILDGIMELEYESKGKCEKLRLNSGDTFHIPPGTRHRMIAVEDCRVLETSTPHLADLVRLEDDYGRSEDSDSKDLMSVW